jgi:methionyl-tRNA formyltransferase
MRVTFLTQDDPLYILPFFHGFFAQDHKGLEVTGIFACRSMGNRKRSTLLRELASLYGIPGFVKLLALQGGHRLAAVLRLRLIRGQAHSLRELSSKYHIPYRRIGNPNSGDHFEQIAAHEPEVLISVACPFILKRDMLNVPSVAALNIHHAPLPRYKGMMPTFWQMYHGERTVGITIHTMAERLDEGSILRQECLPVIPGESMHDLIRRSKRDGGKAMVGVLQQFAQGVRPPPLEPSAETSYFTFPNATEMRIFRERGFRAI